MKRKWILQYKQKIVDECLKGNPGIVLDVAVERSKEIGRPIKPKTVFRALAEIGVKPSEIGIPNKYRDKKEFENIVRERVRAILSEKTYSGRGLPVSNAARQDFYESKPVGLSSEAFLVKLLRTYSYSKPTVFAAE